MQQIVDFILELDRLKGVTRKTRPLGLARYENSAEHSWQIALLAASMAQYAEAPVDIDRVIAMLLVHDIGEIDTGDTLVYAEEGWEERKEAELAAVVRIFGMLPDPQRSRFMALWQEFEDGETAEAALRACGRPRHAGDPQPGQRGTELEGERHQPRARDRSRRPADQGRVPRVVGLPAAAPRRGARKRMVRRSRDVTAMRAHQSDVGSAPARDGHIAFPTDAEVRRTFERRMSSVPSVEISSGRVMLAICTPELSKQRSRTFTVCH